MSISSHNLINAELLNFLHNKVNSFIKWDLVRFFHDNPHTKDTVENVAKYVGRDTKTIQHELNDLVKANVLCTEEISGFTLYRLAQDTQIRQTINTFIEACHDRQFRIEAIHHVIKEMQFSPRHDF